MKPIDMIALGPTREVTKVDDNTYVVTVTPPAWSMFEGGTAIRLNAEQFQRYQHWRQSGCMIQDAFPDLTPSQREILLSGLTDDDFAQMGEGEV